MSLLCPLFVLLGSVFLVQECQYSLCNKMTDPSEHAGGIACLISDWRVNELQPGDL